MMNEGKTISHSFSLSMKYYENGNFISYLNIPIPGLHNLSNITAAIAASRMIGVDFIEISDLLKMNSRITKKLNREDVINQGFSFEFTNKIFESKKNTIHENETSDNYYVVKVISDSEVKFNNERFNVVKKSVNKIYGIDNLQQITKILENKFPISVNKNLLNEFIDRLQY